jgi:hypothetical protein
VREHRTEALIPNLSKQEEGPMSQHDDQDRQTHPEPLTDLAVYPIADYPDNSLERIMDESLRPSDTIDIYGYCAPFCADDRPPGGLTVAEHGPWCTSRFRGTVEGRDERGASCSIFGSLVKLYTHGVYRHSELLSDLPRWHNTFVRLSVGDDAGPEVLLPVGEARRLAAGLTYLADAADDLIDDINSSVVERKRTG